MTGADLMDILEKIVQIIQPFDAFIQCVHNIVCMLCELHWVDLFFFSSTLTELFKQIQEVLVFLEQSVKSETEFYKNMRRCMGDDDHML